MAWGSIGFYEHWQEVRTSLLRYVHDDSNPGEDRLLLQRFKFAAWTIYGSSWKAKSPKITGHYSPKQAIIA